MQITKRNLWNPFRELEELSQRMNRMFGVGNGSQESLALTDWTPSCNVSENDKSYLIRAELPDVKKDDVHVKLENGILTIQGERKTEKEEKDAKFHRRELSYGSFYRSFTMPDDADESKVDAKFKDGMLNVTIGKSKAKQSKAKEITVS
jgi:HSP20 family protein